MNASEHLQSQSRRATGRRADLCLGALAMAFLPILVLIACSSSEPAPAPRPVQTPFPTLPLCVSDLDCPPPEVCVDGFCVPPAVEQTEGGAPVQCSEPCAVDEVCTNGVCMPIAGGTSSGSPAPSPCLDCPTGFTCNESNGLCEPPDVLPQ
jgi:hypothetical protein